MSGPLSGEASDVWNLHTWLDTTACDDVWGQVRVSEGGEVFMGNQRVFEVVDV